jgi:hypothetical protein
VKPGTPVTRALTRHGYGCSPPALRRRFYGSVGALHKHLDKWLRHCNPERPHQRYRNRGARPIDTVWKLASKRARKVSTKKPS